MILAMTHHGHFCQDTASAISEIREVHAADFWQCASDQTAQVFCGTLARKIEAREARQIEHTDAIAHCFDFFLDALLPWAITLPCLCAFFGCVVAVFGKPIRAFPSIEGTHLATKLPDLRVNWRELLIATRWPFVMREVHRVFVAVGLQRFRKAVIVIGVIGVTTRIDGPHVIFCFAVHDPFRQDLTRATTLSDAESEGMAFKRIRTTRHWADHRQAIRGIGDRSVNVTLDPTFAE